ncbi:MAG: DedA family protein [Armatimonadetes bacterium]|nr:DedA family protein [Armatimonadota bacterium]
MFEAVLNFLEATVGSLIDAFGYGAVVGLMALESACIPIPSEIIMPLGGILAHKGVLNFHLVSVAGAFGCSVGSAVAYWAGIRGGRPFLEKYGRYLLIRQKEIDHADAWFARYGQSAVFIARLLPVIRTFISFPAGIHRMRFWTFLGLSFLGSLPWCYALAAIGYYFQEFRPTLREYFHIADYFIIGAAAMAVAWWVYKKRRETRRTVR